MIKTAIHFKDKEFERRISEALASSHSGILPIISREEPFDIIVSDSEEVASKYAPRSILLNIPLSVTELVSEIFETSMRQCGKVNIIANRRKGKSNIVLFCSAEGGVGCTTAAVGLCRELRRYRGHNVCYVNLEPFGSERKYFAGEDERFSYFIEKTKYMKPVPDEFFLSDIYGARAVPTGGRCNELLFKSNDNFLRTINLICESGFDYIIVDTGSGINENILSLVNFADHICFFYKEEPAIRGKKMLAYFEDNLKDINGKIIRIKNFVSPNWTEQDDNIEKSSEDLLLEYDRTLQSEDVYIDGAFGLGIKEIASLLSIHNILVN
ncbi:MAG: ParA family protein [Eubacteriales bacterium]|nr:ParA family protein [Eubacteriales bacterium]MDD4389631.1 ParA family protein [Eubacteriales bacterium]